MLAPLRRAGALVTTAALVVGLVSCSGGQSVAEACSLTQGTVNESVGEVNAVVQSALQRALQGEDVDFDGLFEPITASLEQTRAQVTNEEVGQPFDEFVAEYTGFAELIEGVDLGAFGELSERSSFDAADPDAAAKLDDLQQRSEELQHAVEELQIEMSERQDALNSAGRKLSDVCNA